MFFGGRRVDGALRAFGPGKPGAVLLWLRRRDWSSLTRMCRNIRALYNFEPPATDEEIHAAALQYVRKISGFTRPSQANQAAFARAVEAVSVVSAQLLIELNTSAPSKDRETEAAKARARAAQRYAA
jgi:hypothetical protein